MKFSKNNGSHLQFLENQFFNLTQENLMIIQYFTKSKSLSCEISELDSKDKIGKVKLRRKMIYKIRIKYEGFITLVQVGQYNQLLKN